MKILFVTGDHDCECEGTGIIPRAVKAPPDYDPERQRMIEKGGNIGPAEDDEITINVLCDCVEAREAEVSRFDDESDTDEYMLGK
jgi:hypothetical protein